MVLCYQLDPINKLYIKPTTESLCFVYVHTAEKKTEVGVVQANLDEASELVSYCTYPQTYPYQQKPKMNE